MSIEIRFETVDGLGDTLVRPGTSGDRAVLMFHGAGLEPTHKLYTSFMRAYAGTHTVAAPFFSASHFLSFGRNLRDYRGWAVHNPARALDEALSWFQYFHRQHKETIVMGHSWGAYLAAQLDKEAPLFLASPISGINSIIETNCPIVDGEQPPEAWLKTVDGAPFPFLGGSLISHAREDVAIVDCLTARTGPTLILFGAKEHPKISDWLVGVADAPRVRTQRIEREGHFYSCRGEKLAACLEAWARTM